ncbi:hypothetical protein H2198_009366 [Neophaeococcomyces mojaviensis]|uniref:Uncharacterized protein n=1 Tax=Neophaeococcomyces mojaviensis TaxID=3383035 RepID=A0ACC2ZUP6_9EURO|nr:hypothetical protein H2198_009366 [Knufia sp. JES_112]
MARNKAVSNQQPIRQQPKRTPLLTLARTFGSKSPIVDGDIQAFLMSCMSIEQWESYTEEEKKAIIQTLPPSRQPRNSPFEGHNDTSLHMNETPRLEKPSTSKPIEHDERPPAIPPLSPTFISSDTYLKRAVARFKRDVSEGYYEKTWQDKAKKAHKERQEGKFDAYLEQHIEEIFVEDEDGNDEDHADELGSDGEYNEGRNGGLKKLKMDASMNGNQKSSVDSTGVRNEPRANMAVRRAPVAVK